MACRFSLSVMGDHYITAILQALRSIDLSGVESDTNHLSTLYRGECQHVVNTVRDCFVAVNDDRTHITLAAMFFPLAEAEFPSHADGNSVSSVATKKERHFMVTAQASLCVLGVADYEQPKRDFLTLAQNAGLYRGTSHGAAELAGDVHAVFDLCYVALSALIENHRHFVLNLNLSVNSPTLQQGGIKFEQI